MTLDTERVRELCRIRDAGIIADAALRGTDHAQALTVGASPRELGQLVEAGVDARHQLVDNGIGLVKFVIARTNYHGDWTDVFQEGVLAVVKAVDRYDPDRGAFSTFMWPHIKGAVLTAMATDTMRLHLTPRQARDRATVLTEMSRREAAGLPATRADLASALNISEERLTRALAYRPHAPLGDPLRGGQDFADPRPVSSSETLPVERYVAMLPPTERSVIELLYGLNGQAPRTLPQVATTLGCSRSTAHRLQDQSHRHLHELLVHFGESTSDRLSDGRSDEKTPRFEQTLRVEQPTLSRHPHGLGRSKHGLGPGLGR
jgi:RNA polymerase nonessential primary-like sigma factor